MNPPDTDPAAQFESFRQLLLGIAYRMLGSRSEAEDVVQESWLRWQRAADQPIDNPRSWLVTVCSRLALDELKSARVRRMTYYGTWLPEPFVNEGEHGIEELDDSVSIALLVVLEKLSPHERAAFLLHDVFGYSFRELEGILGRSEGACRKLASRARLAIQSERPRSIVSADDHRRMLDAFVSAAQSGELDRLRNILTDDVELHADGGGKAPTAAEIVVGNEAVAAFFHRVWQQNSSARLSSEWRWFNGGPAIFIHDNGTPVVAFSIDLSNNRIRRIFAHRNPDKLAIAAG